MTKTVEIKLADSTPSHGLTEAKVVHAGHNVYLHKEVEMTTADIAAASVKGEEGNSEIEIKFHEGGAKKLAKLSEEHLNKKMLAIVVDGEVVAAAKFRAKLGPTMIIKGDCRRVEQMEIVAALLGK